MHNNYIVIEGLEGAGKTTAKGIVINTLKKLGIQEIILTHEPGGTKISEKLRNLVLDTQSVDNEVMNSKTELLIFYAARVQLVETVIKPALKNGMWVISDRHDLSTQAYQGGGRGIDQKILTTLFNIVLGDFRPGLTLYLDVTPEVGLARTRSRGNTLDRFEKESLEFFYRTRIRYLELAKLDNSILIIDAMKPLQEVAYAVKNTTIHWFRKHHHDIASMASSSF